MPEVSTNIIPRPLGCLTRAAVPSIPNHTILCDAEPVRITSGALSFAPIGSLVVFRRGDGMRGFLTRIIDRRLRRLALGAAFGVVVGTTSAMSPTDVADSRFDNVDLAAERAQILLTDACGAAGGQPAVACEKRLQKVLELLARVRQTINEDAPAGSGSD